MGGLNYDVIIIGAGLSGTYFAKKLVKNNFKVLLLEKSSDVTVGKKIDLFLINDGEFIRHDLHRPVAGDPEFAMEFGSNALASIDNSKKIDFQSHIMGVHFDKYLRYLHKEVLDTGLAEIRFEAQFKDFIYEDDKIVGVKYSKNYFDENYISEYAKLVIDCTGVDGVGRTKLPDSYGIYNKPLTDDEKFFVIMHYLKINNVEDFSNNRIWPNHFAFMAPTDMVNQKYVAIGSTGGFLKAEDAYDNMLKMFKLPENVELKIQKGVIPYRQPLTSFVGDNLIIAGDAASTTKPYIAAGFDALASMIDLSMPTVTDCLKSGDCSKEKLWPINVKYALSKGRTYAYMRTIIFRLINSSSIKDSTSLFDLPILKHIVNRYNYHNRSISLFALFYIKLCIISRVVTKRISKEFYKDYCAAYEICKEFNALFAEYPTDPKKYAAWDKAAQSIIKKI